MFHTQWGDKHFYIEGGANIFTWGGGQTFYVGCVGGYDDDDVDEEMDVNKANFLVSEFLGARISLKF